LNPSAFPDVRGKKQRQKKQKQKKKQKKQQQQQQQQKAAPDSEVPRRLRRPGLVTPPRSRRTA